MDYGWAAAAIWAMFAVFQNLRMKEYVVAAFAGVSAIVCITVFIAQMIP